ncbi:uncharacterized protein GGS25DRAFT_317756 [Hypoxylon fragiforme]|uniref:uncharacterized protein n=1 Tax=Hypoxylon fragiforme TaxID=63214 RepID=UPI0020C5ED43|nr:uncharacterized protein GGS25DRAFT_317756 [Hypoxylon fragiforme]KAI2607081.1 hypothetical protein GGS25DRAFT_317756 [Hypoxylon fragiforme]
MSTNTHRPLFTRFRDLPLELRRAIWGFALPDDVPEICIPWPVEEVLTETPSPSKILKPFLVDTCFPTLMHVSREAREVAISRTKFRYSPLAGCNVPFRAFRPDLDILYVSLCRPPTDINVAPNWGMYPSGTRHVALDLHTLKDGSYLGLLLSNQNYDIRTVTCVMPAPQGAIVDTATRCRPPVRRCRIRPVEEPTNGTQSYIILVDRGFDSRMTGMSRYLEEVSDYASGEFVVFLNQEPTHSRIRGWNVAERRFDAQFLAGTFEEYRKGRWVDSSDHAVHFKHTNSSSVRSHRPSDSENWTPLRNPEKFRVNDIQQNEVLIWG